MTGFTGPFRCPSDEGYPVTVLKPRGLLTFGSVALVRSSTLKALTNRPDLVLFDVSEPVLGDDVTLTVFPAMQQQAAAVDVAVALVAPSPTLLTALRSMAVARSVAIYPSKEGALVDFARRPLPDRVSQLVLPGLQAGVEVRALVDRCCERWGVGHLADPAAMIAT